MPDEKDEIAVEDEKMPTQSESIPGPTYENPNAEQDPSGTEDIDV